MSPSQTQRDLRKRSVAKALTYRVTGLTITMAAAWLITGEAQVAAVIGVADTAIKLVAYYAHERMWDRLRFGRVSELD